MDDITQPTEVAALPPTPQVPEASSGPSISLQDNTNQNFTPISLVEEASGIPLTPNGMQQRAQMAHYALQDKSPGVDQLMYGIQAGSEPGMRVAAAQDMNLKNVDTANQLIMQIAGRKGGPLTPSEQDTVLKLAKIGPTDPNVVWEQMWANNYAKELLSTPSQPVKDGMANDPQGTLAQTGYASKMMAKMKIAESLKQEYDKRYEDLPLIGNNDSGGAGKADSWVLSTLESLSLKKYYDFHNVFPEVKGGFLPGENLTQNVMFTYGIDNPSDFANVVRAKTEELWKINPHYAQTFLEAMVSRPASAEVADNLSGVADVSVFVPFGRLARGAKALEGALAKTVAKEPVVATPEALKAAENIWLTPDQIKGIQKNAEGIPIAVSNEAEGRTVKLARGMTPKELQKAADAVSDGKVYNLPLDLQNSPVGFSGATRPILDYTVEGQAKAVKPTEGTIFVNQDSISRVLQTSGENQRRLFVNSDGKLEITERTARGWSPTGTTIPFVKEPSEGLVAFNLGPESKQMGSKFYDNYRQEGVVSNVRRSIAEENATPRDMSLRDIDRAREGTPGRLFSEAEIEQMRARQSVQSLLSSGIQSIKQLPVPATAVETKADLQGALTTLGRIDDAAQVGAAKQVESLISTNSDAIRQNELLGKSLPGILRPNQFWENASGMSRERALRNAQDAEAQVAKLMSPLNGPRVMKDTPEDLANAVKAVKDKATEEFRHISDMTVDVKYIDRYDAPSNSYWVDVVLGKRGAVGFDTRESAENTANGIYKLNPGSWTVKQEGESYFLHTTLPVDQRDPLLKNTMVPTGNKTPMSPANMALNLVRSAADLTSPLQRAARDIATHAPQQLKQPIIDVSREVVSELTRAERKEMNTLLSRERLARNTETGDIGVYSRTASELQQKYLDQFGKLPTENFIKAYDSLVRLNDLDGLMRALSWHGEKATWGARNWSVKALVDGKMKDTAYFEGKEVPHLDVNIGKDEGFYIADVKNGGVFRRKSDYVEDRHGVKDYVDTLTNEQGYKFIKLFSPLKKPLAEDLGNKGEIHYVLTNTGVDKPLVLGQGVDWQAGFHHVYLHENFVKQPIINGGAYYGDHTFRSGGSTEAESRAWASKYDTARQLLKEGKDKELDAHLKNSGLPETSEEFKKLFDTDLSDNALDINTPIVHVRHGRDAFQDNPWLRDQYTGIKNYLTDPSNPEGMLNQRFVADRAKQPLQRIVTKDGNQILDTAPMIDPYATLTRAIGQAVRSRYMDDYKTLAATSFVKEFGKYMVVNGVRASPEAMLRNPLFYLYHASADTALEGPELAAFNAFKRNVNNFVGMRSELGANLNWFEKRMQDSVYNYSQSGLPGGAAAKAMFDSDGFQNTVIPFIKDPARYLRATAFNTQIGLFNPVQLFVQAQTHVNVVALSPRSGMRGEAASALMAYGGRYADDPAVLDRYANIASKIGGWNKQDFLDAVDAWKQSGVSHVAGETAWKDDFFDPKLFMGPVGKFLDASSIFFRKAEQSVRDASFFTAFHEWRMVNPGKALDQYSFGDVMRRFDDLSLNMTRASNNALQSMGPLSLPLQFTTFNFRLADQFLGSRLTTGERARLFASYAGIYGLPLTASAPLAIAPLYDMFRSDALDRGVNMDNNMTKFLFDGMLGLGFKLLTGKDTSIAKRASPAASEVGKQWKDMIFGNETDGNKTLGDLVAGPSGQLVHDVYKNLLPAFRHVYTMVSSDAGSYPVVLEDAAKALSSIATVSNAEKWIYAANLGKWYSRSGAYIGDANGWDGFLNMFLGAAPQQFADDFLKLASQKDAKKLQESAGKEMRQEYSRGMEEYARGNDDAGRRHFDRARYLKIGSDMRDDEAVKIFGQAGNQSLHAIMQNKTWNDPRASIQQQNIQNLVQPKGNQ